MTIIGIKPGDKLYYTRPNGWGQIVTTLVDVEGVYEDGVEIRFHVMGQRYQCKRVKPELLKRSINEQENRTEAGLDAG